MWYIYETGCISTAPIGRIASFTARDRADPRILGDCGIFHVVVLCFSVRAACVIKLATAQDPRVMWAS